MKHTSFKLASSLLSLSVIVLISCNNPAPVTTTQNEADAMQPIASVELGPDGKVEFFVPEPGCLITQAVYSSPEIGASVKYFNPVELYEYFSGEEAPATLQEAFQNSQATDVSSPDASPAEEDINGEPFSGLAKTQYSAEDFIRIYCNDLEQFDFSKCLTNRTGNNGYIRTCTYWKYIVNMIQGQARFQYWRWNGSSYDQIRDYTVLQGQCFYYAVASASPAG